MKTFQIYKQVSYEYFVDAESFDDAVEKIINENPDPESEDLIEFVLADIHDGQFWDSERENSFAKVTYTRLSNA